MSADDDEEVVGETSAGPGRTVQEFVLGVRLVPTLFSFFWIATFGGAALFVELETGGSLVATVNADIATAIYVG